MGFYRATLC